MQGNALHTFNFYVVKISESDRIQSKMEPKLSYIQILQLTAITAVLFVITVHFSMRDQSFATVLSDDITVIEKQLQLRLHQLQRPNINASYVFDAHRLVLGNNVKNLVVLIPNEAHESTNQPRDQYPLANQPYLPQNAIVNVGTARYMV